MIPWFSFYKKNQLTARSTVLVLPGKEVSLLEDDIVFETLDKNLGYLDPFLDCSTFIV